MKRILLLGLLGLFLAACQQRHRVATAPPAAVEATAAVEAAGKQIVFRARLRNVDKRRSFAHIQQDSVLLNRNPGPWWVRMESPSGKPLRICGQWAIKMRRLTPRDYVAVEDSSKVVTLTVGFEELVPADSNYGRIECSTQKNTELGEYTFRVVYDDVGLKHRRAVKFAESPPLKVRRVK